MLIVLRILFGAALAYELVQGARIAPSTIGEAGDVTGAFYVAVCVGLGILNALVWAPYLGSVVSGPLTGMITESTYVERTNWILRLARWFENRGSHRVAVWICFLEAIRHPSAPSAFVIGFRNARPGSWLEKVFAREVFGLNNIQNCVQAYLALKRHAIDPRPHSNQEINIVLLSLERKPRPEPAVMSVPAGVNISAIKRNPRIRLFRQAEAALAEGAIEQAAARRGAVAPEVPQKELDSRQEPVSDPPEEAVSPRPSSLLARVVAFLRAE